MKKIEIYTQPNCSFCRRAVQILTSKNVPFKEIHAPNGTDERAEAVRRSRGARTVPQIFIDDHGIGGCTDLMQLDATGQLDQLLGKE